MRRVGVGVVRRVLSVICLLLIGLPASQGAYAQAKPVEAWLGLAAGTAAASETVLAADLAGLFADSADLRVRPMLGDAGAANLALLLDDPNVDLAFVATDVLARQAAKDKRLTGKLELVFRLAPQEIHVLARSSTTDLAALSGKQVGTGPAGSASAAAASSLFETLRIEAELVHLDAAAGIERLKRGELAAVVIVGGAPALLVAAIPINAGLQLLPISFGAPLDAAYLPARLGAADYPNLIRAGSEVPAIATGIVLLAAGAQTDPGRRQRIDRFLAALFPRFAELQVPERHPKWREVNLAANLPGFKRAAAAEAWLAAASRENARPITASVATGRVMEMYEVMSTEQQEALFEQFIEWQRGKSR